MNAWSHLPNARHINAVIANIRSLLITPVHSVARDAAVVAAWYAARDAANAASRDRILDAAWTTSWSAARNTARDAAQYAILALVAYDYCDRYLTMTSDQLQVWGALSADPAAILLLSYVTFMEHNTSKELA
jgi:hypothetical protein